EMDRFFNVLNSDLPNLRCLVLFIHSQGYYPINRQPKFSVDLAVLRQLEECFVSMNDVQVKSLGPSILEQAPHISRLRTFGLHVQDASPNALNELPLNITTKMTHIIGSNNPF